ncbi:hypothetical protein [Ornithinibacillus sp. JPR2-1]|uniref:hypothetical protein n=1 Tax=Ornithinibacillus sp. JPR2-1 TaxID=2094019 RepID=UPI0031D62391
MVRAQSESSLQNIDIKRFQANLGIALFFILYRVADILTAKGCFSLVFVGLSWLKLRLKFRLK